MSTAPAQSPCTRYGSGPSADLERQVETDLVIEGTVDVATVVRRLGLPQGPMRVIAALDTPSTST